MKKNLLLGALGCLLMFSCTKEAPLRSADASQASSVGKSKSSTSSLPPGNWILVQNEDFNSLNLNAWGHGGTPWGTESHDGSCNLQTASNSWVSNGSLIIRAQKGPITGPSGKSYPYSGDYVWTKTRRTYGYLEIRAQYPNIAGGWPAWWMLGEGWPPEIDIAEYRGGPRNYMTHALYDGTWKTNTTPGDFTGWHTYGLLWEPGSLKFYIDDVLKHTVMGSTVPSIPMYVILSNGVDCGTANGTGFPNNYVVDYFRWYQAAPATGPANGTYTISNRNSGKCLTLLNGSTIDGTAVVQYTCNGDVASKWTITQTSTPGEYTVVNNKANKPAEIGGFSTALAANVTIWGSNGGNNQKWQIMSVGGGYYKIKNLHSGLVMDMAGWSTANNANDVQYTDSGGANQQWQLTATQ